MPGQLHECQADGSDVVGGTVRAKRPRKIRSELADQSGLYRVRCARLACPTSVVPAPKDLLSKSPVFGPSPRIALANRGGEVEHVGLGDRAAAAWSRTSGAVPHRVMTLGRNACLWAFLLVEEELTDAYYRARGLRTNGIDPDMHGAGAGSNLNGYVPMRWRFLRELFRSWPIAPGGVLLDYGSGKGRTVIWAAARYRFRRVIGVELDAPLHASAQANLARWKGPRLCDKVELVCADATEFQVPDDVTVIYFFNPFTGGVFEKVLRKIQESIDRNPRELVILYAHPRMHDSLVNAGFTLERQQVAEPYDWATYRYPKCAA